LKSEVKTKPHRPKKAEGLDIDFKRAGQVGYRMLKMYYNVLAMGKTGVRVMRSPTGGFHIYCDGGFNEYEAMLLGDCAGRLKYWERQGYTFTFNRKMTDKNVTIGTEELVNPLHLPFFVVREVIKKRRLIYDRNRKR